MEWNIKNFDRALEVVTWLRIFVDGTVERRYESCRRSLVFPILMVQPTWCGALTRDCGNQQNCGTNAKKLNANYA